MTTRWALTAGIGLAVTTLLLPVPAAGAAPIEHEHFHEVTTEFIDDFCGDLDVRVDSDVRGMVLVNPRGRDGLPYFKENVHSTVTYTNLANGKTFTLISDFVDRDQRITDNGDGTFTILVATPGRLTVRGSDGKVLLIDAGTTWFEILIDNGGTPTDPSDDEFLEFLGITKVVGRQDIDGRDFCDDLHEFIG